MSTCQPACSASYSCVPVSGPASEKQAIAAAPYTMASTFHTVNTPSLLSSR
jgi:hypothetical protein